MFPPRGSGCRVAPGCLPQVWETCWWQAGRWRVCAFYAFCLCLLAKGSAFGFYSSFSMAFKPLLLGGATSAKRRFGLLSKTQTRESVLTYFTVCNGETFELTTAVEAGGCTSAAHAVNWSGNTHKIVYYSLQGAGPILNMVFDMSPNKYFNRTLQ